jgi:hypothetical protein
MQRAPVAPERLAHVGVPSVSGAVPDDQMRVILLRFSPFVNPFVGFVGNRPYSPHSFSDLPIAKEEKGVWYI